MKKHIHLFAYFLLSSNLLDTHIMQAELAPCDTDLSQKADIVIADISEHDENAAVTRSLCGSRRNCNDKKCTGCTPKNDCCTRLQCRRTISTLDIIESKVCLLTECEAIPLSQSDVVNDVLTIAQPGLYCLATDISGSISIEASEVTLDLNGHTVTAGTAVTTDIIQGQNVENISVQNGIVDANNSASLNAISFTSSANIYLSHLTIRNANLNGILATTVTHLLIEYVLSEASSVAGSRLIGCSNVLISDSTFSDNTRGLLLNGNTSTAVIVTNCHFINNSVRGVDVQKNSIISLYSCIAAGNKNGGFLSFGNMDAFDCVADNNKTFGFLGSIEDRTTTLVFERCVASNNIGQGFVAEQGTSGVMSQCIAFNNTNNGFIDQGSSVQYTANYATGNSTNDYNPNAGPPFNPFLATDAGISFWYNTQST
jgi:Right handed beta helix region